MPDLLIKNATLPDGRNRSGHCLCRTGELPAIEQGITAEARETIDARRLPRLSAIRRSAFPHGCDTLSRPAANERLRHAAGGNRALGRTQAGIQSVDEIIDRALRYCDIAASMGIGAIRTHVDTCDDELKGVQALLEVRRRIASYIDLQLVAFPQDGVFRSPMPGRTPSAPSTWGWTSSAAFRISSAPWRMVRDPLPPSGELAAERGLMVDMHCDETDDPLSRHVETLAFETQRLGLVGRVTGSHLTSMHSMDNYYVSKLIPLMVESGMHAIANPPINILIQGRHDTYPKRRGLTRVRELRDAGVTVGFGQDCMMDPWHSLGSADMLDVAVMGLHVGQLSSMDDMRWCFRAVTENPARIMNLEGYGVAKGCDAHLVLLHARDPIEAIRLRATRLAVIRQGRVIARTLAPVASLDLPGRPSLVDPSLSETVSI